ncbi:uncharacterized protein LOC142236529 isoform X2 [Haematobia irritans]|uniref:uncharacterized protein LOC142236529 isoform X2 n=1 Tax=Haematobia irritans TaxID=7368 RepID=UPI003F4F8C6C
MEEDHSTTTKAGQENETEVSLPGSNEISIEQPAILQVLSPINATEEKKPPKSSPSKKDDEDNANECPVNASQQSTTEDFTTHNDSHSDSESVSSDSDDDKSSVKQLVSSSSKTETDHLVKTETATTNPPSIANPETTSDISNQSSAKTNTKEDCEESVLVKEQQNSKEKEEVTVSPIHVINDKILDIESHLIETLNDAIVSKESVGINELPPAKEELQVGCSKIETAENVRSVIEVEPAEVISKQPVEQIIDTNNLLQAAQIEEIVTSATGDYLNGELSDINKEEIAKAAQQLLHDIEAEVVKTFETNNYNTLTSLQQEDTITEKTEPPTTNQATEQSIPGESGEEPPKTEKAEKESCDQVDASQSHSQLSQVVDQQISEVTSILDSQNKDSPNATGTENSTNLKLVTVPTPQTESDEAERKRFIESLPSLQGAESSEAEKLALDCKREYYQSLKKYLVQTTADKPPVPLQTYRWEDLRRAKERGGYPWTHLYKRPLGPNEEPEIVLMLRKSQEIRFLSESPKSNKKVRIDDQVLIQETYPYLQELSEEEEDEGHHSEHHLPRDTDHENNSLHSESFSCVSDSVLATAKSKAANRFNKVRRLFRRRRYGNRSNEDAHSLPDSFTNSPSLQHSLEQVPQEQEHQEVEPVYQHPKGPRCFPMMKKLKSMADRQKKRLNIKRLHLGKEDKVAPIPDDQPKIMKLKSSPKAQRSDIPHFIEKQDSDDVLEIEELDESPSRKRLGRQDASAEEPQSSIVQPEEIIEISEVQANATSNSNGEEIDAKNETTTEEEDPNKPPMKAPRLRREHVYEEIDQPDDATMAAAEELKFILDATSVDALKQSLATQDNSAMKEVAASKSIPLDRMGSSEEEALTLPDSRATPERKSNTLLAPISSIDSASSDEDRTKIHLQPVTEEEQDEEEEETTKSSSTLLQVSIEMQQDNRLSVKKEASPAPSDKKVTFSHVEDDADPHREDIELPPEQLEATKEANKWKATTNDHEYEPIGIPSTEEQKSSDIKEQHPTTNESQSAVTASEEQTKTAEDFQREIEEHFFKPKTPGAPTPQTELTVEPDSPTEEAVDESAETTKGGMKSFMASAQDRTRKMQMGLKSQAGKLRTKFKASPKKSPSSSPKAKERRKFKAPEFSKMKMPDIKRPDMSKLKDFKRPEFTKFSKPDMSKFKLPEMPAIKLGRSKSFKESEPTDEDMSVEVSEKKVPADSTSPQKKLFDFGNLNFGTYPRVLRKKKKPLEVESSFDTGTATEATSVIPSTTTQPSVESSSSPQGDRGPGPVRSRWADKFSDVSYNDSEGSRYRRYGSEQESFDRESSLERRMREDLEDTVSEEPSNMGILGGVTDNKEFAEFDEENRAIHEISNLRSGEFRRRPMVHQDSDLRSEDDAVGWTEREIQKNILLRKGELEAEASYQRYHHDNQSTASSGKKVVLEEIGEDEFFLRKRGISQDNIEINQYIRSAIRGEDYDKPINTLQHVGQTRDYGDYDVPPPKPKRLHKHYQPTNDSQEFESYGDEFSISQNGSAYFDAPRRPMRKGRSRSKYSMESQDVRYLDDEFSHEPSHEAASGVWNDLNMSEKENIPVRHEHRLDADEGDDISRPQPPRRHKRRRDTSMDKDSYINGFGGRSVSNSFLQPTEDVIVYRTEHEYHHVPIATPDKYSDSLSAHNSSKHYDMDNGNHHEHHTSQGAISMEQNDEQQGDDETDKYVIEMLENDGYAIVRKDHQIPKPTPPARRKKFTHLPGDRFATMPNMRTKRSTPPPERPPPPRGYTPVSDIVMPSMRKSAISLDARPNYQDEGDYEEPGFNMRPESPRSNLQSGDVINKMKYRPLPPPPRPPREKRNRSASKGSEAQLRGTDEVDVVDGLLESDSHFEEVEASTQTDPLPDDFVCEEFEITDDMKVIEPRIIPKTIEEMLQEELEKELQTINHQVIDSEQLSKGLQRFRESNQRSLSERSRASSQADRSKSQSRPQTPSAIMVERQSSTPILKDNTESMVEASLLVRPIDDLELEEEELRREGLLTDESQHSQISDHRADIHVPVSEASYAPSSTDIDGALPSDQETQQTDEEVERTLQRYRDELDEIGRQLMETQLTSQEGSPSVSREDMLKDSDREEHSEKWETSDREDQPKEPWQLSDIEEMRSDMEEVTSEREDLKSDMEELTSEREELKSDMEELKSDREDHKSDMEEINSQRGDEEPTKETHTAATGEPEEGEEEEEAPFEKEFTPLPKEYRVDTPTTSAPLPPPRRKSTTAIDHRFEDEEEVTEPPVETKEVVVMQTIAKSETPANTQIPARLSELEVERLRVHALQAGQIMVSQLHGQQISSEELECKSGNLVVKNIELPPGLIEDIVERVRQTERTHHLTAETQTSVQSSSVENSPVRDVIPPPKPPRLRDLESAVKKQSETITPVHNTDEQTQTDAAAPTETASTTNVLPGNLPSTVFPTAEYLQSLAPLAFYNLHRAQQEMSDQAPRQRRHRRSVSPSGDEPKTEESSDDGPRRRRTRSTRTPSTEDPQSITKAGRKFITACSLSLAKIINQLTDYVTGKEPKEGVEDPNAISSRHVPALAVLFLVITFCVLIFLLTGRNVHTHHWDYFNPPGQDGRPS